MYKQVIVVRADLKMGKGKIGAQVSHASLLAFRKVENSHPEIARRWEDEGQKKVVLKVNSEKELFEYFELAKREGIPAAVVRDAGHTQIEPGTVTCFGAGPWEEKKLDEFFGKLKLL
jgi:PTH2 family peptidyl-tRNA hydrolase